MADPEDRRRRKERIHRIRSFSVSQHNEGLCGWGLNFVLFLAVSVQVIHFAVDISTVAKAQFAVQVKRLQ